MTRRLLAELVGTAILVYVGCGTATQMFGFHLSDPSLASGVVATALAFGLVLMGLAYAIGPISGAHVNPAVTLGMLVAKRIDALSAVYYWCAQFAGGLLGALALWATFRGSPTYSKQSVGLGANGYGSASSIRIDWAGAFIVEIVLTTIFVYVVLAVTSKRGSAVTSGLVIGLTLTLAHLVGILVDGTSVNPARSLGPAVILGGLALHQVWLFVVAPLIGGALAAVLHHALDPETSPSAADASSVPTNGAELAQAS
jgi:aquaporin Z